MQTKEKQPQGSKARIEDIDGLTDPRRSIRPWMSDRQSQNPGYARVGTRCKNGQPTEKKGKAGRAG